MRIALVSPYSWTYPGGVTRHIEALGGELDAARPRGARSSTPFDPHDRLSARLHRGVRPQRRDARRRTWSRSGARSACPPTAPISNVSLSPLAVVRLRRELRRGGYDVVHIHEPIVPLLSWDCALSAHRLAAGRDLPHLLDQPPHQRPRQPRRRGAPLPAPARADRGLAGRGMDRRALLRRALPRDPQRRARAGAPRARRRRRCRARSARCGSSSSARRSSARGCRSRCAPSRRCASTSRRASTWSASTPEQLAPLMRRPIAA